MGIARDSEPEEAAIGVTDLPQRKIGVIKMAATHDLSGPVILEIAGNLYGNCLGRLRRQIGKARRLNKPILIDLGEVTLVDPDSVHFLAEQTRENIKLINCPEYIEPWIHRELQQ